MSDTQTNMLHNTHHKEPLISGWLGKTFLWKCWIAKYEYILNIKEEQKISKGKRNTFITFDFW